MEISACNAMETLLIHEDLMEGEFFNDICNMLKREDVKINAGPKLHKKLIFGPPVAKSLKHEYGELECCIEIVSCLDDAINHIHVFGSAHTDVIITENGNFLKREMIKLMIILYYSILLLNRRSCD